MEAVEQFSTEEVPYKDKKTYWNDCICDSFTAMEASPPDDTPFWAKLTRKEVGDSVMAIAETSASTVTHAARHIRAATERVYMIHVQRRGTSLNRQNGREVLLKPGDFTICDSSQPYSVQFDDPIDMLVLRVSEGMMHNRLPLMPSLTALHIDGGGGLGCVASTMLNQTWDAMKYGLDQNTASGLFAKAIDLVALSFNDLADVEVESISDARLLRLCTYIRENLHNPDLTPASIAEAFGISLRRLHSLFQKTGQTVSQYIITKRLESAREMLRNEAFNEQTITNIAFMTGFKDSSHFGRIFKAAYGYTPRDYRFGARNKALLTHQTVD